MRCALAASALALMVSACAGTSESMSMSMSDPVDESVYVEAVFPDPPAPLRPEPLAGWSQTGVVMSEADAIKRLNLRARTFYYSNPDIRPDLRMTFRHVQGDLHVAGPLLLDWEHWPVPGTVAAAGLVVDGDLHVAGPIINANSSGGPFLLVKGRTRATAIVGGGAEMRFDGDTHVADVVIGHDNGGVLRFFGGLSVPVVIDDDHHLDVVGRLEGESFDLFRNEDSWPGLRAALRPDLAAQLHGDNARFAVALLLPYVAAGQAVTRAAAAHGGPQAADAAGQGNGHAH